MTFPNNPNPGNRRALSEKVSRKGWAFGVIIVVVAIIVVLAFVWAGNSNSTSGSSSVPAAGATAGGGPQAPSSPPRPRQDASPRAISRLDAERLHGFSDGADLRRDRPQHRKATLASSLRRFSQEHAEKRYAHNDQRCPPADAKQHAQLARHFGRERQNLIDLPPPLSTHSPQFQLQAPAPVAILF